MKTASQTFNEQEREAIRQAVITAEKKTGAEIVPVVATASGRYDRAEDVFGFTLALACLAAAWMIFGQRATAGDFGGHGFTTLLPLPAVLILLIVIYPLGAALATWFPALRLPFLRKMEIEAEVERSASAAFHNCRVHGTGARAGVLIYVSLYERMVRVIPDSAVASKIPNEAWKEVADLITAAMAGGTAAEGLCAAIARCGDILGGQFPRLADDVDELSNDLRLLD